MSVGEAPSSDRTHHLLPLAVGIACAYCRRTDKDLGGSASNKICPKAPKGS